MPDFVVCSLVMKQSRISAKDLAEAGRKAKAQAFRDDARLLGVFEDGHPEIPPPDSKDAA